MMYQYINSTHLSQYHKYSSDYSNYIMLQTYVQVMFNNNYTELECDLFGKISRFIWN